MLRSEVYRDFSQCIVLSSALSEKEKNIKKKKTSKKT